MPEDVSFVERGLAASTLTEDPNYRASSPAPISYRVLLVEWKTTELSYVSEVSFLLVTCLSDRNAIKEEGEFPAGMGLSREGDHIIRVVTEELLWVHHPKCLRQIGTPDLSHSCFGNDSGFIQIYNSKR